MTPNLRSKCGHDKFCQDSCLICVKCQEELESKLSSQKQTIEKMKGALINISQHGRKSSCPDKIRTMCMLAEEALSQADEGKI